VLLALRLVRFRDLCSGFPPEDALSEAGASRVPIDWNAPAARTGKRPWSAEPGLGPANAVEIVPRNFVVTFLGSLCVSGRSNIIGEDNLMVDSDYPHFDSTMAECPGMTGASGRTLSRGHVRKCVPERVRIFRHRAPAR